MGEVELRQSLEETLGRATQAERSVDELRQQRQALTTSGKSCEERLEVAETQLRDSRRDVQALREQLQALELQKFQSEREVGELKVQLSSLREQLAVREQLVTNQGVQIEQGAAQRKSLEDMLATCRQQNQTLEEKFALSAKEIEKGNQIIQSLHTGTKQAKAKLRLKTTALQQQE